MGVTGGDVPEFVRHLDMAQVVDSGNEEYYRSLRRHELRLQRCSGCGYVRHPARPFCPECLGDGFVWETHEGTGRVEAIIWYEQEVHLTEGPPYPWNRPDVLPYNVAVVRLDGDGPQLLTNIHGVEPGDIGCGQAVRAQFADVTDDYGTLHFRPSDA